ncbi:MAG: hypothetical protein F6K65_34815 [Moorea sp. SIO3C2]|nr:hypothetical protein [Moorena sp. SIO3C2]
MKFIDLKLKVLTLADVQNSQELKRCYSEARSLNLSYRKSWEALLTAFQAEDKPERIFKPNISELKTHVLNLANVETAKQLKQHYAVLKKLDFRYYSAWETALSTLNQADPINSNFQKWLESPPEEYKELFQEIEDVSEALKQSIKKGKKLVDETQEIADNIITAAQDAQSEVDSMKREIVTARNAQQQAELN